MDEVPFWQDRVEFYSKLANIDVNRPIAGTHLPFPDEPIQLIPGHDAIGSPRQFDEQSDLSGRKRQRMPVDARKVLLGCNLERTHHEALLW